MLRPPRHPSRGGRQVAPFHLSSTSPQQAALPSRQEEGQKVTHQDEQGLVPPPLLSTYLRLEVLLSAAIGQHGGHGKPTVGYFQGMLCMPWHSQRFSCILPVVQSQPEQRPLRKIVQLRDPVECAAPVNGIDVRMTAVELSARV